MLLQRPRSLCTRGRTRPRPMLRAVPVVPHALEEFNITLAHSIIYFTCFYTTANYFYYRKLRRRDDDDEE